MIRVQAKIPFKWRFRSIGLWGMAFTFLLGGCTPEKPASGILSEKEMVRILMEIYIAEAKVERLDISRDSIKRIFPKFEAKVFDKTGISDSVFKESMKYYLENPKKLENIYAALVDSLNLKGQIVAPVRRDSASRKKVVAPTKKE